MRNLFKYNSEIFVLNDSEWNFTQNSNILRFDMLLELNFYCTENFFLLQLYAVSTAVQRQ